MEKLKARNGRGVEGRGAVSKGHAMLIKKETGTAKNNYYAKVVIIE